MRDPQSTGSPCRPAVAHSSAPPAVPGAGAATGARFLVNDAGVLFGVHDEEAAERLGLANPVPAPWPVLAQLPRGPELSVQGASFVRDSVGRRRSRVADAVIATRATDTATQIAAPRTATCRLRSSGGLGIGYRQRLRWYSASRPGCRPGTAGHRRECVDDAVADDGIPAGGGRWAVSSMRCMTCRAVNSGERDAEQGDDSGDDGRGVTRSRDRWPPDVARLSISPSPSGSNDTTSSPGAATSTHGPARLNGDGVPSRPTEPTVST